MKSSFGESFFVLRLGLHFLLCNFLPRGIIPIVYSSRTKNDTFFVFCHTPPPSPGTRTLEWQKKRVKSARTHTPNHDRCNGESAKTMHGSTAKSDKHCVAKSRLIRPKKNETLISDYHRLMPGKVAALRHLEFGRLSLPSRHFANLIRKTLCLNVEWSSSPWYQELVALTRDFLHTI